MTMKSRAPLKGTANVKAALARAVGLHQAGDTTEAAALYEQVLRVVPGQTDALHLLGLIKGQRGEFTAGIELIRKAIRADGKQPAFHLNLGRLLETGERWGEAADSYGRAARLAPFDGGLHRMEGVALTRDGRPEAAARCFVRALALSPEEATVASDLGDALYDLGRMLPAAAWYGRAASIRPDMALALFNRGAALRDAGRVKDAIDAFRAAASASPGFAQAWEQMAGLSHGRGDRQAADRACRTLLTLTPNHAEAAKLLGANIGDAAGRPAACLWFARAARLRPGDDETARALGSLLHRAGNPTEAARWFRHCLLLAPDDATALSGLGLSLASCGASAAAEHAVLRAVRLDPSDADLAANAGAAFNVLKIPARAWPWNRRAVALRPDLTAGWINIGSDRLAASAFEEALSAFDRALVPEDADQGAMTHSNRGVALMALGRLDEAVAAFRAALAHTPGDAAIRSNMLFCLCFTSETPLGAVFEEHRRYERCVMPGPHAAPRFDDLDRNPERRLRVGYLSPDFQRYPGPGYHFLLPLLERHDRARVEVTAYYNDVPEDAATARFKAAADRWRPCAPLSDDALERLVRADGIDILVDCGGHMSRNRMPLFIRRPAPVQISMPLYPNTTGLSAMDYQFADARIAPPYADALHSERLIRLPGSVLCYHPAESAFVPPQRSPVETTGQFTFGSFNNITKVNPATIALWARLLTAAPDARLMLKWRGLGGPSGARQRLLDAFAAHGVGSERLIFRGPTPDPYEDLTRIDCALDPVFANGGTTICDALWMNVPVLAIAGQATISRWSATMLGAVGLDALVTGSEAEYLELGVRLATDRRFLAAQRDGLRERMVRSPLRDEAGYARSVEAGYRRAWRRWCAGLAPEAMIIAGDELEGAA